MKLLTKDVNALSEFLTMFMVMSIIMSMVMSMSVNIYITNLDMTAFKITANHIFDFFFFKQNIHVQ